MKNSGRKHGKRLSTYDISDMDDDYSDSLKPGAGTFFSSSKKEPASKKPRTRSANDDQAADKLLEEVLFRAAEKNLQLMQDQANSAAKGARDGNISYESVIKRAVEETGEALAQIEGMVTKNILANTTLMMKLKAYKGGAEAHVKNALNELADIHKEDFDEIDFKKISTLVNALQQLSFKLHHETVTKTKFFQKAEQARAQELLDMLAPIAKELGAKQKSIVGYKMTIGDYRKVFLDPLEKIAKNANDNLKRAESEFMAIYHEHRQNGGELPLQAPAALELVHQNKALPVEPEAPKFRR